MVLLSINANKLPVSAQLYRGGCTYWRVKCCYCRSIFLHQTWPVLDELITSHDEHLVTRHPEQCKVG